MKPFEIRKEEKKFSSINRTIRIKPETFEILIRSSEESGVSFNKLVNQCIEYALSNMNQSPQDF